MAKGEGKKPKILERRVAYEGRKIILIEQDLEFPDGHRETWEHVELKGGGGVQILGLTEKREVLLIREYRGGAGRFVTRFPTGSIEGEESPESAAQRELEEEVGVRAGHLELMHTESSSSSYYRSNLHVFFATDFTETEIDRDPGEQNMEVVYVSMEKALEMAQSLEIRSAQTIYSLFMLNQFAREKKF